MNKAAKLVWYCKTENGWKRFNVVTGANGKIRTGVVLVDGKEKKYPVGSFQLRTYEGSKTVYKPAGTTSTAAETVRQKTTVERRIRSEAKLAGIAVSESGTGKATRLRLQPSVAKFVQRTIDAQAPVAAKVYARALKEFEEFVTVAYVDQIDADTMLAFHAKLRKQGNSPRTIANKHLRVCTFLRWGGIDVKRLGMKVPKYDKRLPTVYDKSDIDSVLMSESLTPYWRIVLQLLRQTGLREKEAVYLQWSDMNFSTKVLRVRSKPALGFTIKDREERDIPIPNLLLEELKLWKDENPRAVFVIGTSKDTPNLKLLRGLKRLIHNLGLNCGTCDGCLKLNHCRKWNLHSFRRTYATSLSRAGIDARTIMAFMGHSDIETTMKYLAAMSTTAAQPLIDKVKW